MNSYLLAALVVAASLTALRAMGRVWGEPALWTSDANSAHTSQRLADPYSFSHVIHGFIFYALLSPFQTLSLGTKLLIAVLVECAWEVSENTPAVINRYRTATASLGYTGDSLLNSFGDVASMVAGFFLARALPWQASLALAAIIELVLLYAIRDNLTLNVLQLVAPNARIKAWQQAGNVK